MLQVKLQIMQLTRFCQKTFVVSKERVLDLDLFFYQKKKTVLKVLKYTQYKHKKRILKVLNKLILSIKITIVKQNKK